MTETTALKKFHCPACGAEAHWNVAKQMLVCPYCGTSSPAKVDEASGEIQEHDLVTALRQYASSRRGWQAEKKAVRCQSCQAISVFDPGRVAQRCDFCGSAALVPYEQTEAAIHPESLLPFKITESSVRETVRHWYGSRWFAPNRLKSAAMTDTVKGIYLPYWTFDAEAHADWTADSGYYYYVTETYRDSNGQTRTRQVQHIRWQPSSGHVEHFFDDELVSASQGVKEELLRDIEPFPTDQLASYSPSYLAGWIAEQYQIDLIAAAQASRQRMDEQVERLCADQVPGDTQRNLRVHTRYTNQTFKHVLLPVWLLTYNYGSRNYQVVVNGFTGQIAGHYPRSWIKITLFILFIAIVAGIAWLFVGR